MAPNNKTKFQKFGTNVYYLGKLCFLSSDFIREFSQNADPRIFLKKRIQLHTLTAWSVNLEKWNINSKLWCCSVFSTCSFFFLSIDAICIMYQFLKAFLAQCFQRYSRNLYKSNICNQHIFFLQFIMNLQTPALYVVELWIPKRNY